MYDCNDDVECETDCTHQFKSRQQNCPCEDNCLAGCPCDDFDCDSGEIPGRVHQFPNSRFCLVRIRWTLISGTDPDEDKMVLVISSHPSNKPIFKLDFNGNIVLHFIMHI